LSEVVGAAGEPDIVFVMVNTARCAGTGNVLHGAWSHSGSLAAPTFSIGCADVIQMAVHELGHSFAHLADEYVDEETAKRASLPDWVVGLFAGAQDLTAPNVTVVGQSPSSLKWRHFLDLPDARRFAWLHEGGYYRQKGVFRPWPRCRMRASEDAFCPVCSEAVARSIYAACDLEWDDGAYHRAHPLDPAWAR
jgi:hypothetical protein